MQPAVDEAVIDQAKGLVEFEDPGKGKLQDAAHIASGGHLARPHFQRGFGRPFDGPAQGDERGVDRAAGTTHHHVHVDFFTLEHFHQSEAPRHT
jgi:hypothetical protein